MKKLTIFLVLAMVAGMIFAGAQPEIEKPDVVTIMVWNVNVGSDQPVIKYIEDKLNIKIEWRIFPHSDRATAVNLMVAAGGEMPDIFPAFLGGVALEDVAEKGIITPWSDFMEAGKMPLTVAKLNDPAFLAVKNQMTSDVDGKIYGLPDMYNNEMWTFADYVRSDWMEKVGITKDPETVDEYRDMLRAFKALDPNGNGKADEVGWINWYKGTSWMKMFTKMFGMPTPDYSLSSVDTLYWAIINHNEVVFAPIDSRFKAMLIYINSLWEEGLIHSEQFNMTAQLMNNVLFNNTLGTIQRWPNSVPNDVTTLREVDPDAIWHAYPYPIDPRFMTPDDRKYARRGPCSHTWVLSGNSKNQEAAVRFMDYIFGDEEFVTISEYGIEGVHHKVDADGDLYYIGEWAEMDPSARMNALGSHLANLPHEYRDINNMQRLAEDPIYDDYKEFMADIDGWSKPPYFWKIPSADRQLTRIPKKISSTYIDESITKFVIGTKSFNEWDEYVATVEKEFGEEIEVARKIFQDYFENFVKEFY